MRVLLIVEELFTDTIKHGYGRECSRPSALPCVADGGASRAGATGA